MINLNRGAGAGGSGDPYRLLTLNIGGPSAERAEALSDYLLGLDLDFMALTETRDNAGTRKLIGTLAAANYHARWPVPPSCGERGVALLCRNDVGTACDAIQDRVDLAHRLVVSPSSDSFPCRVIAAYVPSRNASPEKIARKQRFIEQLLDVLSDPCTSQRTILMGDLNVVGRTHEPRYSAFRSWEYEALDRIEGLGYIDVFAVLNPGVQAHSWIGRTGAGYRYDYAFVSADLLRRVIDCEYVHHPRQRRLTDHAGVILTVAAGDPSQARRKPAASGSTVLGA